MKKMNRTINKTLIEYITIFIIICMYVMIITITGIGCPILFFTGIPCLGCGMTRACFYFLRSDFSTAFSYHPLVFLLPMIVPYIIFMKKLMKYKRYLWGVVIIIFLLVYLVRLVCFNDPVVRINLEDGFIYKMIITILERRN